MGNRGEGYRGRSLLAAGDVAVVADVAAAGGVGKKERL